MAGSILVKDFLKQVSTGLLDMAPQFRRWSEQELVGYLNDGQRVIAKFMPHSCSRVDAVKLTAGTRQHIGLIPSAMIKPGDGSSPANTYGAMLQDVIRNMGADGLTPGRSIRVVDREVLDSSDRDWHTKTGTPSQYVFDPRNPKVFYVSPGVAPAASVWVELSYLADPQPLPNTGNLYAHDGMSTTKLSIDDRNVDDLYNYVLARANLKDAEFGGNANLAVQFTNLFVASINAQVLALTGVNPNLKMLPMNPSVPAQAS